MGSIYDNEARKNDRAKNRALQQENTSAVKAAVGAGAMRAPGSTPGNTSGKPATQGGTPGGTTSNTAKNTTAPSPQKPPAAPNSAASSGASSAVETVLEQETPLEEQIASDEPQQEEEPAFVPVQSRSSAVSVLSGEKQGTKLLSPRELLESRKTGENPALTLGRNIAQTKETDAHEAAKNDAAMESASETARANTQRAADRAKNQQEQAAARVKSYEQTVSEFISADTTGNILKPQELAALAEYLGSAANSGYENEAEYQAARTMLDESAMRAALLGDMRLSEKYGNAVTRLDREKINAKNARAQQEYQNTLARYQRYADDANYNAYAAIGASMQQYGDSMTAKPVERAWRIMNEPTAQQYMEQTKDSLLWGVGDTVLDNQMDQPGAYVQDSERRMFNYILAKFGEQAALDYYDFLDLDGRVASARVTLARDTAQENPVGAFALSGLKSLEGAAGYPSAALEYLITGEFNPDNPLLMPVREKETMRQITGEKTESAVSKALGGGAIAQDVAGAARFAHDIAGSFMDSRLGGVSPGFGAAIAGSNAGASALMDAKQRGATDEQAFAVSAVAAGAEAFFEHFDLEKLGMVNFDEAASFGDLMRLAGRHGVVEGTGELLTEATNMAADAVVMKELSSFQSRVRELVSSGMTYEQAKTQASTESAKNLALSYLGGYVSGGAAVFFSSLIQKNPYASDPVSPTPMLDNAYDQTQRAGGVTPMLDRALDLTKQEGKTPAYTPDAAPAAQDRIASDAEAFLQALEPAKPQAQIDPMVDILLDPQKYLGGQEQTNESTVVNTNPENHTPVQQAVIDAYRSSVDDGLVQYVQDVMNDQVSYREKYNLNPMSDRASADIKALTGVDTTGFQTAIERKTIEHILKRHGEKGIQDRSMRDIHDIARIQYVLDNYDSMKEGDPAEGYTTIKPNGRPKRAQSVVYEKAVNGTYYVVEAVPDTKSKTAYIVSAYMSKNPNEKAGAFRLADAAKRPPYVTSETGYAATPAHDENAHQLLLHGQSLPQSMADDISVNNRLASAEPAVNTNMLKTGGNDAQNRPFTAGDISVQNTAASWQSADLEGRAKTPEQFRQRIHEQPYQQTIDAVKAAKEKARDARISAQKIKSVLGLDNAGRELFDLLVKNPGDQKSAALAVSQYGGRFMTAVQMQIDARTAKQQADAYARAIASARLEKAQELTYGLRFEPASAMKSAGNWFRNSDEVFLRTFGNTQRTRDFHRATVGMVDANEALRVTDLNQTLSQFESMRLNAAESALEQLISDTGLRQDHQTLLTAADLQQIAGANLTAQDTRRLAGIARRMQRETARAMKAIQKAGMDARSAMQETDAAKLPPQVGAAVRAYEAAMEPLYAQARQVTDHERVQDIVALCGAGWINPQAVETLHDFSVDKILNAKEKLDAYYEKTWQDASDVYVLGGYDPIGHIAGYRPHTLGRQLQQKSGILGQAQALFGRLTDSALPLEIAGRTEDFKPGRRYMPNFQNSRTGFEGYLDSMAGLAQYAPAASHVVYHTGDIQMLRALGANIRLENASDTVRGDYLRILQNNELSDTEKQAAADSLPWGQSGAAAPFVTWLDEYTNIVAGKTSTIDRVAEKAVGRATLDFMAGIKRMTGAAMVKYNIGSAVSNLAPLFQAGDLGSVSMTKGLVQSTLDALSGNLSFYDQFDFVKNRLTQTQADLGYDRGIKAAAQKTENFDLMGLVDAPVTRALARAYYNQAIRDGYSESEAVLHTNERLNSVMGGRSLGQNPLIFESKTLGPLTQYKRESYRDLWMRQRDMVDAIRADAHLTDAQKRARIVSSMARFTVGTAVFGEATGSALGYVVAFSPVHVIAEMLKAAGMLEDDNDEDKLGQELMQIWDDVKARLSGQEAQRTVAQALGDFFNIRIGDGLAAQEYEGLSDVAKALLAPLWEEVPMVGSRQGQGSMPAINQGIALVGSAAQAWDILFSDMDAQDKATALAQGIGKQTARTFVPGGNQLQKTALGAADLIKGYHEGYNAKDGALQAQYALSQDPTDIVQTLLFGPSANAGARAYYESGSWPLSADQTQDMHAAKAAGMPYGAYFDAVRQMEAAKDEASAQAQAKREAAIAAGEDPGADAWVNTDPLIMAMGNQMGLDDETLNILLGQQMTETGYKNTLVTGGKAYEFSNDPDLYWAKAAGFKTAQEVANVLDALGQTKENHLADGLLTGGELRYAYTQRMDAMGLDEKQQQYILQYLDDQDAVSAARGLTGEELKDYAQERYGLDEETYHLLFEVGGVNFNQKGIDLLMAGMKNEVFDESELVTMTDAVKHASTAKGVDLDGDGRADTNSIRDEQMQMYLDLGLDTNQMRLMFDYNERDTKFIDAMEKAQRAGVSCSVFFEAFKGKNGNTANNLVDGFIESQKDDIMDAQQFAQGMKIAGGAVGVKGADGKTISGSKKYNIVKGLAQAGYTDEQIAWFLTKRPDGSDGEPMYKNMQLDYYPEKIRGSAGSAGAGTSGSGSGGFGSGSGSGSSSGGGKSSGGYYVYDTGKKSGASDKESDSVGDVWQSWVPLSGKITNKKRSAAIASYEAQFKITNESAARLFDGLFQISGENKKQQRMDYLKASGLKEDQIAWIWNAPTDEGGFGYKTTYKEAYYDGYGWSTGANGRSSGGSSGGTSRSSSSGRAKNPAAAQAFMKRWGLTGNPWGGSAVLGQSDYASRLGVTQSAAKRLDGMIPLLAAMDRAAQESFLRAMGVSESGIAWLTGTPVAQGGLKQA